MSPKNVFDRSDATTPSVLEFNRNFSSPEAGVAHNNTGLKIEDDLDGTGRFMNFQL